MQIIMKVHQNIGYGLDSKLEQICTYVIWQSY